MADVPVWAEYINESAAVSEFHRLCHYLASSKTRILLMREVTLSLARK